MPECVIANIKIHIEVPLLLFMFASIFFDSVKTNLIIYRTCYVTLGYNKSECALLGSQHEDNETNNLEKIVEPYAAVINMAHSLTEGCVSAIICLFVGPWSDKFGRLLILKMPIIGFTLFYLLYASFAFLENISPWYSVLCYIPLCLTGGGSSYFTAVLSYVTDVTDETNRGMRMGILEAVFTLGIFLGNISNSYVLAATNYPTVFLISSFCIFLSLIFTVFFIPESLANPETEGKFRAFFQFGNMKNVIKTTIRRRENYDRCIVLCCVLMLSLHIFVMNGNGAVMFLFLREKFKWSLREYTLFSAASDIIWMLGTIVGIYVLHKTIRINESVMILLGFSSMISGMLITGFAKYQWEIYVVAFSRVFGGVLSPMVRSLVSKIVPNEEVGKIFAFIVASQSMIGLAGSPIYTVLYNNTIYIKPSIYTFVSSAIYLFEIFLAVTVIYGCTKHRNDNDFNQLTNEDNMEERNSTGVV